MSADGLCPRCGHGIQLGEWPFCKGDPADHAPSVQTNAFAVYFDHGLGCEITSLGDRWRLMKEKGLTYREHPSKGELSARRDKIEARKRAAQERR